MWRQEWAANEEQQVPTYEAALELAGLRPGDRVLDVGCGTGVFLRMCADRGAVVAGIDGSEAMVEAARARVPEADVRAGDLQSLPYADGAFDLVTGFSSFFFAGDVVAALREAGRVGARVVIVVFGRPERCEVEAVRRALGRTATWRPQLAEERAAEAGLTVERSMDLEWAYEYAGDEALLEAMLAGGAAAAARDSAEQRAAIVQALRPCRQPDGSYRVSNEWHVVLARA
jgi:SAM-dependent methyltransferase